MGAVRVGHLHALVKHDCINRQPLSSDCGREAGGRAGRGWTDGCSRERDGGRGLWARPGPEILTPIVCRQVVVRPDAALAHEEGDGCSAEAEEWRVGGDEQRETRHWPRTPFGRTSVRHSI